MGLLKTKIARMSNLVSNIQSFGQKIEVGNLLTLSL